ncbi:hypothetical protein BDY19DRAFT_902689 [Irpex rosettiformis]|uniref:Uncharacterized protein n=1 Tax=Irpex rosettiformis TaxID=378272 RepID=A0ACB8UI06_9APHY|nr:hypothetical protein BDY19DRAFT_902689 [Irpex rosettiformis]
MARQKLSQAQTRNLPAHETKHIATLEYKFRNSTFHLNQRNDGSTNGTALWMGGQVLSAWLAEHYSKKSRSKKCADPTARRPRVIELGSGIGLTALAMCSLGWDVFATDLPAVVDSVLLQNIATNMPNLPPGSGTIEVRVLDWNVPPMEWIWQDDRVIASETRNPSESNSPTLEATTRLAPAFDLIISADTVYSPSLVAPLLRAVDHLSKQTSGDEPARTQQPSIFICLERRDPIVIERLLDEAKKTYTIEQVPERTMLQTMEKNGLTWNKNDWDGLEIWSFRQSEGKRQEIL